MYLAQVGIVVADRERHHGCINNNRIQCIAQFNMISVNCEWNNWGPYTECIGICGTGTRNRTRRIKVHSDHGGLDCVGNFTQFDSSCTILDKPCPGKSRKHHLAFNIHLQIDCPLIYKIG